MIPERFYEAGAFRLPTDLVRRSASAASIMVLALLALVPAVHPVRGQELKTGSPVTPVRYLVVIFQENVSFDHYFATYPHAANPPGEPRFEPALGTPTVNGLSSALLSANPNSANPFRFARAHAATCDQNHRYTAEQLAYDHGLMDQFVQFTNHGVGMQGTITCGPYDVMGYFDGNTVTALWNYAQHFAMSDNSFDTMFGSSTPGALHLAAGETHGTTPVNIIEPAGIDAVDGTLVYDVDPLLDDCSGSPTVNMAGRTVGDLLNEKDVTWGWFEGGFRPTTRKPDGVAVCGAQHRGSDGAPISDYLPHHEPFQYYQSTANPHHLPPLAVAMIGKTDQANHQYDLEDFWAAVRTGNLPAVSFLKAPAYQDGHAHYSDPLAEQVFLVETINRLQRTRQWSAMAIVIAYDDSDGWYDHVMPPIVNRSDSPADALTGPGSCGQAAVGAYAGRCGYGPRLPLLVISPFARINYVDHVVTDQTSILQFIEDNWRLGRLGGQSLDALAGSIAGMFNFGGGPRAPRLFLNPASGEPVH